MKPFALLPLLALALAGQTPAPTGTLVSNTQWPRTADLATWTADVMRIEGVANASETAQGKAFFTWLRLFCRMAEGGMIQAFEGRAGQERFVLDAHKNLFVYGWGYCDTCSRIADAAWKEYKKDPAAAERVIVQHKEGGYHTMYRLRMDGAYGAFDPRYGYYLIDRDAPDARVLDWREVGDDAAIHRNKLYRHRSRPFFEIGRTEWARALEVEPAYFPNQTAWEKAGAPKEHVFGDSHYQMGTRFHDMSFRLPRGTTITRYWNNDARKFYRPSAERARKELPFLPSGRVYRVSETSHDGNWPQTDPNYLRALPYLTTVPTGEGYPAELAGSRTIGQAWGEIDYQPDLTNAALDDVFLPGATLVAAKQAPYLRPAAAAVGGTAVLDFYSPYVLVDGELDAAVTGQADDVTLEIRTLNAKTRSQDDAEEWSAWRSLPAVNGRVKTALGEAAFPGQPASVHGVYRFQLRLTVPPNRQGRVAGLSALRVRSGFENGIMTLPRLFAGRNDMRLELQGAAKLRGPVTVSYRYRDAQGVQVRERRLQPAEFAGNAATFSLETPGLIRCESVTIRY
jgi:hypothetical protein